MLLRNGKTYKDDPEELEEREYCNDDGDCNCWSCKDINGCVFHVTSKQEERKKKAKTKALAQVMYEAQVYALEKANGDLPEGIRFLDFYLLYYRSYYEQNYERTYLEVYEKICKIALSRLLWKKPEHQGHICHLCHEGVYF